MSCMDSCRWSTGLRSFCQLSHLTINLGAVAVAASRWSNSLLVCTAPSLTVCHREFKTFLYRLRCIDHKLNVALFVLSPWYQHINVFDAFLANVNSLLRSRSLYAIVGPPVVCLSSVCRLSVFCNVRAPYSGDKKFPQRFYAIWYPSHLLKSSKILRRSSQGNPYVGWVKHKRGSRIERFWTYRTLYLGYGAR